MKKNILMTFFIATVIFFTLGSTPASAQLEVITVHSVGAVPGIPHDTYNGVDTTFKAIA